MDKIKPYLELLKKHHFWPLAVIVVLLCAYGWYSGTAAFDAAFSKNRGQIMSAFGQADAVRNNPNPPNVTFAERLQPIQQEQINSTLSAWQTLYDRQKGILIWNIEHDRIARLQPEEDIPKDVRDIYLNYFSKQWPAMLATVDPLRQEGDDQATAQNRTANSRGGRMPSAGRMPTGNRGGTQNAGRQNNRNEPQTVGIVDWPQGEREAIEARYRWRTTPSNIQVRLAQEDYWVYKTLLEIIANTNKSAGATRHSNAAIKKIETLAIAQAASAPPRVGIEALPKEALPVVDNSTIPKPPGAGAADEELLAGRYASADGQAAAAAPPAGGTAQEEFKLMPVLMRFVMDERRIPNLLVACANAPLPVEVRHVLYNPSESSGGAARPAGGAMGGGMRGGVPNAGRGAAAPAPARAGEAKSDSSTYDATVEVRGVVYIFNPPSKTALGLPEEQLTDETSAPLDSAATAEQPLADNTAVPADAAVPTEVPQPAPDAAAPVDPAVDAAAVDPAAPVEATNTADAGGEGEPADTEAAPDAAADTAAVDAPITPAAEPAQPQ